MKYDINNLPDKVKVVRENDVAGWEKGMIIGNNEDDDIYLYLGLEAGILEPYDEEDDEQENLREEIVKNIMKRWGEFETWENVIKEVLKDYKITKR